MFAEIKRIVDEDISSRVTQHDVLNEAITNAIHANATEITCILDSADAILDEAGQEITQKKLNSIRVIDNGDGFDEKNYDSFCKYRSEYKKDLGCRGVGRFVFLKVYDNALFISRIKKLSEERKFNFDLNFDTDNLKSENAVIDADKTEIRLENLSSNYVNHDKYLDRRIYLDLNYIREKVLLNLIPTLFFYKKKGNFITIIFKDNTNFEEVKIIPEDIPNFKQKYFSLAGLEDKEYDFILNYYIDNTDGKLNAFYCANNRTVCEFSDKDFKMTLPYGYSGYFLLESVYFDSRVNNERNDFDIFPVREKIFSSISWERINEKLKLIISELVKEGIPETEKINKDKILEIQEERPYLINYIEDNDIDIAGFIDKKHLIDKAKKRFDNAKEKLLTNSGKENYTDDDLNEAIQITQYELVSYIFDRAQVLERLQKLVDKKERVEKIIHNLFMERNSEADYYCIGKNNLWLIDDRFTTYSYAASDKRIKDVLKQIGEANGDTENLNDKPDLSLFFSHNPKNSESLKSVLIEIKPFDYESKPDRKKFAGIQQLRDYVKAFRTKEKIDEIFAYLITDIDSELATRLRDDDYKPLFSLEAPIYYRYYQELGISIYVVSAHTLIQDAKGRNKVFLDIIKKQSKFNKLLTIKLNEEDKC
jgi:hypothetical protein